MVSSAYYIILLNFLDPLLFYRLKKKSNSLLFQMSRSKGTKLLGSSVNEHNNNTYLTGYHRDDTR